MKRIIKEQHKGNCGNVITNDNGQIKVDSLEYLKMKNMEFNNKLRQL